MFEDLLVEKKVALLDAMPDVCKEKLQLKEDRTFDSVKRIKNGYSNGNPNRKCHHFLEP